MGTSTSVFDATNGRLKSLTHKDSAGQAEVEYGFEYDALSRIKAVPEARPQANTVTGRPYNYDLTDQTTKAGGRETFFAANGTRTGGGYSTAADNRLTADPLFTYEYDAEGNRTSRTALAASNNGVYAIADAPTTTGGSWTPSSAGYGGGQSVGVWSYFSAATATWQVADLPAGTFDVYATWSALGASGASAARFSVESVDTVLGSTSQALSGPVNFQSAPNADLRHANTNWAKIGSVTSTGDRLVTVTLSTSTTESVFDRVAADAILIRATKLDLAKTTYEWDHQNRLTKVTNLSTTFPEQGPAVSFTPTNTTSYAYDVLGRRAAVTYDKTDPEDTSGEFHTVSIHDGSQVVWTERSSSREGTSSNTQALLWAPGTDQLLAIQQRLAVGTLRLPVWTLTDHQGTVKDYLVVLAANTASDLFLTRQYSAFGTPLRPTYYASDPSLPQLITDIGGTSGFFYVGQEYDATTGLQYSRARYYDPVSSEFISQDPLGFAGGDTNLYRRDRNQSVSARPRDRNWSEWALANAAAAASFAINPAPTIMNAGYELFVKDSATVWGNTAGMSLASRVATTAGFFLADVTGVRGVDDFFHTHDAADGHVQSRFEQWADGVFGAIGVGGTIFGGVAAAKVAQTLGVKGTVTAGAAYARATVARVGTGARGMVDDVLRAGKNAGSPKGGLPGFGIAGSARGLERGVPSPAVGEFYESVASSSSFKLKLGIANRVSKGNAVGVDNILNQLGSNTKFREVSGLGLSRIDPLRNGQFAIRGRVGGHLARETAEHELLHLAQFLRDQGLASRARTFTWAQRQPFEVVPALVGSPTFVFGSVGGGLAIGGGVWYVVSGD
jgi:RHS repeat-associated protein